MLELLRIARRTKRIVFGSIDRFLTDTRGVIHIGANNAPERERYEDYRLPVVWVEPIPEVFERLRENLRTLPRQRAFKYLVTDRDDAEYPFHVANNDGASSSIFEFKEHKDVWPDVAMARTITLRSVTLPTLLQREQIDLAGLDTLAMDTQGSELLVLKGAEALLHHFKYIKTEAADFEAYAGCCRLDDITAFLTARGFEEHSRHRFASHRNGGAYYDVLYRRRSAA
jgi:FkbM family methyltransferase